MSDAKLTQPFLEVHFIRENAEITEVFLVSKSFEVHCGLNRSYNKSEIQRKTNRFREPQRSVQVQDHEGDRASAGDAQDLLNQRIRGQQSAGKQIKSS